MTENKTRGILLYNKLSSENNLFLKFLTENDEILTVLVLVDQQRRKKIFIN